MISFINLYPNTLLHDLFTAFTFLIVLILIALKAFLSNPFHRREENDDDAPKPKL